MPSSKLDRDPETTWGYYHKNFFVRRIYFKRLKLALSLAGEQTNRSILDVGTGSGLMLPSLAKYGAVYAVDQSPEYISRAKKLCDAENINADIRHASVNKVPFADEFFDVIFCLSVLEHVKDLPAAVIELKRLLKNDGMLIVGVPVERIAVNILFRLFGASEIVKHVHCSDFMDVERSLKEYFYVERSVRLPSLVPENFSLYKLFVCKKML